MGAPDASLVVLQGVPVDPPGPDLLVEQLVLYVKRFFVSGRSRVEVLEGDHLDLQGVDLLPEFGGEQGLFGGERESQVADTSHETGPEGEGERGRDQQGRQVQWQFLFYPAFLRIHQIQTQLLLTQHLAEALVDRYTFETPFQGEQLLQVLGGVYALLRNVRRFSLEPVVE